MIKNHLKEIRLKEFMLNKQEFAKMLQVPYSTYSGWETGNSTPSLEQAFIISSKLNRGITDIWYLVKS